MALWTSATWTISWRAARPAVSPLPTGSVGQLQAVREGSVDIGLCASGGNSVTCDEPPRGIVLHELWSEPIVFVCRPDHPLGGRDRVSVAELTEEMILRFPPGWGVRAIV